MISSFYISKKTKEVFVWPHGHMKNSLVLNRLQSYRFFLNPPKDYFGYSEFCYILIEFEIFTFISHKNPNFRKAENSNHQSFVASFSNRL